MMYGCLVWFVCFFKQKTAYEMRISDWSSDVCSSDLVASTGDIGLFKVVNEGAVSSGVLRIEALTGDAARRWFEARDEKLRETAAVLKASPEDRTSVV